MEEIVENSNKSSHDICSANFSGLCSNEATFRVSSEEATRSVCPLPNSSGDRRSPSELVIGRPSALRPKPTILKNSKKIRSNSLGDLKDTDADTDTDTETELASLSIPTPNTLKYLFRAHIPIDYLYDVLEKICVKNEKYYIIDFNSYRLLQFHELYTDFSERIIQAYKPSKQKYVTRTLTYNSFVTIVRHICRINGIPFDTKFNYQYSLYNIDYYIYFTYHPTPSLFPPMLSR